MIDKLIGVLHIISVRQHIAEGVQSRSTLASAIPLLERFRGDGNSGERLLRKNIPPEGAGADFGTARKHWEEQGKIAKSNHLKYLALGGHNLFKKKQNMKTTSKRKSIILAFAGAAIFSGSASATLSIYEPFAYADTGPINDGAYLGDGNQSGAFGTTGTWSQVSGAGAVSPPANEIDVRSAGLSFTDGGGNVLPVTGGHVTRDNRVGQNSAWISVSSVPAIEGTTTWMTFLYADGGFSGPDSFVGLTSQTVAATDAQALTAAGFGVGIGVNSIGGPDRAIGTSVYDNATGQSFTPEATASFNGPGSSPVHLLAMRVDWNAGADDEIYVFDVTDITTEPLLSSALASSTFNWTQSQQNSLNLLSYADTQVEDVDEIRVASTFAEAVGVPEPSTAILGALSGLLLLRRRR